MRAPQIRLFAFLAFLVLLGVGALTMQQLDLLRHYTDQVNSSYQTMLDLERVLSSAKDVETGARGYLLTERDTLFLQPYYRGKINLEEGMERLENSSPLNFSYYPAMLDSFKTAIRQQVLLSGQMVDRADRGDFGAEERRRMMLRGRLHMSTARRYVEEIRINQQLQLGRESDLLKRHMEYAPMFVSVLAGIALMILAFLFYILIEQLQALKRYRASLESNLVELRTAYENLGRYNTLTNHHLKEPVRKMLLFLDRFQIKHGHGLDEPAHELLQKLGELSHHTHHLLEDLGTISELDTLTENLSTKPLDLNKVVQQAIARLAPQLQATGGSIEVANPLPTIAADENGLLLLLHHLLENALKFARPGVKPYVVIAANIEPASTVPTHRRLPPDTRNVCHLKITDNGRGIAEEHHHRVFQLFYRVEEGGKLSGTGLGLAMCQKIATLHGGFITLQSAANAGSTFHIILPA